MKQNNQLTLRRAAASLTRREATTSMLSTKELCFQIETFRQAQFGCDAETLDALCMPSLSYSHSDGHVEDKASFLTNATNGRYTYDYLEYIDLSACIEDSTAIARFQWRARQTWSDGRVTDTQMAILMVWMHHNETWKLLARSATKLG